MNGITKLPLARVARNRARARDFDLAGEKRRGPRLGKKLSSASLRGALISRGDGASNIETSDVFNGISRRPDPVRAPRAREIEKHSRKLFEMPNGALRTIS